MLKFELNGIIVETMAELEHHEYIDENRRKHSRIERKMKTRLLFWGIIVWGTLQNLALIKSSLSYFIQGYWKRSGKQASKIDLNTEISYTYIDGDIRTIHFMARQKCNKNFLYIYLDKDGETLHEMYLDGQQVLMLEIAIGKAISYLSPQIVAQDERSIYGF